MCEARPQITETPGPMAIRASSKSEVTAITDGGLDIGNAPNPSAFRRLFGRLRQGPSYRRLSVEPNALGMHWETASVADGQLLVQSSSTAMYICLLRRSHSIFTEISLCFAPTGTSLCAIGWLL